MILNHVGYCMQLLNLKFKQKALFPYCFFMSFFSLTSLLWVSFSHFCLSFRKFSSFSVASTIIFLCLFLCLKWVFIYVSITFSSLLHSFPPMPLSSPLDLLPFFSNSFKRFDSYTCKNGNKLKLFLTLLETQTLRKNQIFFQCLFSFSVTWCMYWDQASSISPDQNADYPIFLLWPPKNQVWKSRKNCYKRDVWEGEPSASSLFLFGAKWVPMMLQNVQHFSKRLCSKMAADYFVKLHSSPSIFLV